MANIMRFSIFSFSAIITYGEQTKKAYANELQTQFSEASRKLISTEQGFNASTEADCIASEQLQDSNNFAYNFTKRDAEGNIFDIATKPLTNTGHRRNNEL